MTILSQHQARKEWRVQKGRIIIIRKLEAQVMRLANENDRMVRALKCVDTARHSDNAVGPHFGFVPDRTNKAIDAAIADIDARAWAALSGIPLALPDNQG